MKAPTGGLSRRSAIVLALAVVLATAGWTLVEAVRERGWGRPARPRAVVLDEATRLKVLFLGDDGPHRPGERAARLIPELLRRGIETVYTRDIDDLNPATLSRYHAVILYANLERISPEQESALVEYVEGGRGFVAIHSASTCFQSSDRFTALLGGQFKNSLTGGDTAPVTTRVARASHPIMNGLTPLSSVDQKYVHQKHNHEGRTVLEYRDGEPHTWVRTQGAGAVFYTAWGHDEQTWDRPGFVDLVERGIRWTAGQDVVRVLASSRELGPSQYTGPPDGLARKPLSPEESMRQMATPGGFHVRLFASEPDIHKPACMAWDELGQLWIADALPPAPRAGGAARARITLCQDTDHDGRADRFTAFAEIPAAVDSITFARGGLVVHTAGGSLSLKDSDGDGKFDGTEPVEPEGRDSPALGETEDGLVFGSTADSPCLFTPIARSYYESVHGLEPGPSVAPGPAPYTARSYPGEYRGRVAFVCEPLKHRIGKWALRPRGAGFVGEYASDLLVSGDEWSAPALAQVGPDGNVWFIDRYDGLSAREASAGPEGDGSRARIYRVVFDGAEPDRPVSLVGADTAELVAMLRHDNLLWRRHAERLLVERGGRDAVPALLRLAADTSVNEIGQNPAAIRALVALRAMGAVDGSDPTASATVFGALSHPSPGVRRAAIRALPPRADHGIAILSSGALRDPEGPVRIAALLALAHQPPSLEVGAAVYAMVRREGAAIDRWCLDAAIIAGAAHREGFIDAAEGDPPASKRSSVKMNLLPNPSFEASVEGRPESWQAWDHGGTARHGLATGRLDGSALDISSSGAQARYYTRVRVKPHTRYLLSGWITTRELHASGGGAAFLDVPELGAGAARTPSVEGTRDWTYVESAFTTDDRDSLMIDCAYGEWAPARGSARFDDLSLVEVGPAEEAGIDEALRIIERRSLRTAE